MREILFRGKRVDNREWVYGSLTHYNNPLNPFIDESFYTTHYILDSENEDYFVISKVKYQSIEIEDYNKHTKEQ